MMNPLIGLRMKALREERGANQDLIAEILNVRDRQTVSAIENGDRRAKPEELARLIDHFNLDLDFFTDPFRLVGEGKFSWRQSECAASALQVYQQRAGRWIALYRALTSAEERPGPKERLSLRLWEHSTFEEAEAAGERFVSDYEMGGVPAQKLPHVMESDFGILVLMVDMDDGISGAACRLPELDAVLVNRRENAGRRNFDLAHEFFHILTWDTMPPKRIESISERGGNRIEQLANKFASALLMPKHLLERFGNWKQLGDAERAAQIRAAADYFEVSVTALYWRLVALKFIASSAIRAELLPSDATRPQRHPPLFSRTFAIIVAKAIESGRVSVGKTTKILELSREALKELFATYNISAPSTL